MEELIPDKEPVLKPDTDIKSFARNAAEERGIPWDVANAHITVESNWNPKAKAQGGTLGGVYEPPSSAKGLMQLIDATATRFGVKDSMNPEQNILGGLDYLKFLHDKYGNWTKASQAYKQGEGSLDKVGANAQTEAHMDKLRRHSTTLMDEFLVPDQEVSRADLIPDSAATLIPDTPGVAETLAKDVAGTAAAMADFGVYFTGLGGIASQAVAPWVGAGRTAIELLGGASWAGAAMEGSKAMDRVSAWSTPSRFLTEKVGLPEQYLHGDAYNKINKVINFIPEKAGELAMKTVSPKNEPAQAVAYGFGNFLGNIALFHAAGGAKTVGIDLSAGNISYKDFNPAKLFKKNQMAGQLATYIPLYGGIRKGDAPATQVPGTTMRQLPAFARRELSNLQGKDSVLPSKELENILLKDPSKWSAEDKLTIVSWDKELRAANQNKTIPADTGYRQVPKVSEGQFFWSLNPVRPLFNRDIIQESINKTRASGMSLFTEMMPTKYLWALRAEDRGASPKESYRATSRSVERQGITEPLELEYSVNDHSLLLTKGNTKLQVAMRENIPEAPVYIKTVVDHNPALKNMAVSADIFGLTPQNFMLGPKVSSATPSAVGLPSRDLLTALRDPLGSPNVNKGIGYWWQTPGATTKIMEGARKQARGWNTDQIVSMVTPETWGEFKNASDITVLKDIGSTEKVIYNKAFSPEQAGELSRNPVLNWVGGQISKIKKNSDLVSEQWNYGTSVQRVAQALGLRTTVKAVRDPNAFLSLYDSMSNAERTQFRKQDQAWSKAKYDFTPQDLAGLPAKIAKAFEAKKLRDDAILKTINDQHKELGIPEIPKLPGYSTSIRKGDFFVEVKDPRGNTLYRQQVTNTGEILGIPHKLGGASRLKAALERHFPGHKVEVGEVNRGPGNPFAISVLQLESLNSFLNELGPDRANKLGIGPMADATIQRLIEARQETTGFGGHKQLKQFVPGQKGNELLFSEKQRDKSYREAQEIYAKEAANYVSNLKLDSVLEPALRDPVMADKPNLVELVRNLKEHAKGAYDINGVDTTFNVLFDAPMKAIFGSGKSVGYEAWNSLNRAAYFAWLHLKLPFYSSQLIQPIQFTPAELAHWQTTQGMKGDIGVATLRGIGDLIKPSSGFLDYIEHGIKTQTLDPQLIRKMGIRLGGLAEKPGIKYVLGEAIQAQLEKSGRLMAASTAYNFFKDSGITNKEQLHALVDQVVNNVMVDFHRSSAPSMYRGGSYVAEAAGVLSRYHHNYVALATKYLADFKETGNIKPIGYFIAMQGLAAGMIGMLGVAEADFIIDKLRSNNVVRANFPTVTEYVMKNMPDIPTFGLPSMMTGLFLDKPANISGSLGSPSNIPGVSTLFPSVQWAGTAANALWHAYGPGQHTAIDRMHAIQSIAPTFSWGAIQRSLGYLKPGEPVPDFSKRGIGGQILDEGDIQARTLGMKSIEETRAQRKLSTSRATEASEKDRQFVLIGQLAEAFKGDKNIAVPSIYNEAVKYGIDPKLLTKSAIDLIIQQKTDANSRFIGKGNTLNSIQKYQLLQGKSLTGEEQ